MDKKTVVAIRDSLSNDEKNNSLRIIFDNGINLSLASDKVVWDDENETIIGFVADGQSGSFSAGMPVRIICSTYENIQFMTYNTSIKNLDSTINNLSTIMPKLSDEKNNISSYFKKAYDPRYELKDDFYYHKK